MKSNWIAPVLLSVVLAVAPDSIQRNVYASDLPDFGDSSGSLISPAQEQALGEAFMRSVRSQVKLVGDPPVDAYVRQLGDRLVSHSDTPGYPFTFFVVEDGSVNAFAGPGGYIGVHTGLILKATNESELAGVLAHEIAHVTQRHLVRAYESANQLSVPTAAATIAAILLGVAAGSGDAGVAPAAAIQAGNIQHQLNFTRANEKEADRIGMQTLARSDIDPYGMPSFFERLHQSTRLYGNNIPEFLSTHPVTSDRIAESMSRAETHGRGKRNDSLQFQLIRARLKVLLADNPQQAFREYQELARRNPESAAEQYGLALASYRVGKHAAADKILKGLLNNDPDRILYRTTLANLEMETGKSAQALERYRDTLLLYPGDMVVSQYYAAALIQTDQAEEARQQVLKMLREPAARTTPIYMLWAKASSISGPAWETKQATAEIYYLNGNLRFAIDQLNQARGMDGMSQYDQSRIQARLETFRTLLAEREQK